MLIQSSSTMTKAESFPGIGKPAAPGKKSSASVELFGVKKEWTGLSVPSTWDVSGEDLEMVPWEFPLEQTHREIYCDASLVATRISDVLQALSVEAEFFSKEAKAKCKTTDCVSFRIRLFAGGEGGQPVVVEIQRRCGSASSFMLTCRAVLDAAEGRPIPMKAPINVSRLPFHKKPLRSLKCLGAAIETERDFDAEASFALEEVLDMLRSEKRDSTILGLENLCSLSDPTKTSPEVALRVSRLVVLGGDKYDIREEIRLLTDHDEFSGGFGDRIQSSNSDQLRYLALCALSKSMATCADDGCLSHTLKTQPGWFTENLAPSLVDELKRADTHANNAYQAACCIHSMITCSIDDTGLHKAILDDAGVRLLELAHEIGKARHELLSIETQRCLELLQ